MDSTPLQAAEEPEAEPASAVRQGRRFGTGRWAARGLAAMLVLSVIGMVGYVGWELVGTDVVARETQAELRQEIRERWQHPTVADVVGPEALPALGSANALIRIPRFGRNYEMPLVEGVRGNDLEKGVGHFPGAGPGQIGNFALVGHRVTHGEPFHDLSELRPGDKVVVETSYATYTYVLDTNPNDLVAPFTETWVLDPVPVAPKGEAPLGMPKLDAAVAPGRSSLDPEPTEALITLTTSSEFLHTADRMVAFGHLVSIEPK